MLTVPVQPIFLGIVVVLFFQCMSVLLNPVNPMKRGINWALIAHTVAMLTFLTIPVGIDLSTLFILYINNRDFPGRGEYPPGPLGYDVVLNSNATSTVLFVMPSLNQWLADGLLVGSVSNPVAWLLNVCCSSSCIVATLFIP